MSLRKSKEKLAAALGDDMKTYLEYLKLWFRQKITRDEFESRTRRLLKHQHLLRLHNDFILDLFTDCQSFAVPKPLSDWSHSVASTSVTTTFSATKKRKIHKHEMTLSESNICESSPRDGLMNVEFEKNKDQVKGFETDLKPESFPSYCSNDLLLPDVSLVAGRAKITAWLHGLGEGIADDACQVIVEACDAFLKRIISATVVSTGNSISRRCGASTHRAGPFGRSAVVTNNQPWPTAMFDAIYPDLNPKSFAIDSSKSLLAYSNYRDVVEAQEAHLLAFCNEDSFPEKVTLQRLKSGFQLHYLDLCLPVNFHHRCLIRLNGSLLQSQ